MSVELSAASTARVVLLLSVEFVSDVGFDGFGDGLQVVNAKQVSPLGHSVSSPDVQG